jgi:hypothetical protein
MALRLTLLAEREARSGGIQSACLSLGHERRLSLILAVAALLCGISTPAFPEQCMNEREDIGIRDGANGRPEEYSSSIQRPAPGSRRSGSRRPAARLRAGTGAFCVPIARTRRRGRQRIRRRHLPQLRPERLQDAYDKGREVYRLGSELSSIDGEMRDINIRLEDKDKEHPLEKKERDALMFRLGVLTVERVNTQRSYDDARYRAREL